jgi:hypothetical protein
MKTRTRVCIFGLIAGLIWSVIPGILLKEFNSFTETIVVLVTGAITGLLVSIALYVPLKKIKSWIGFFLGSLFFGIIALLLGAFLFGVLISIMETALTGLPNYFNESFTPFSDGIFFSRNEHFFFLWNRFSTTCNDYYILFEDYNCFKRTNCKINSVGVLVLKFIFHPCPSVIEMKAVILAVGKATRIFYFLSAESGYDFSLSGKLN